MCEQVVGDFRGAGEIGWIKLCRCHLDSKVVAALEAATKVRKIVEETRDNLCHDFCPHSDRKDPKINTHCEECRRLTQALYFYEESEKRTCPVCRGSGRGIDPVFNQPGKCYPCDGTGKDHRGSNHQVPCYICSNWGAYFPLEDNSGSPT